VFDHAVVPPDSKPSTKSGAGAAMKTSSNATARGTVQVKMLKLPKRSRYT
jgi:hypothetical protein